jgi:two-component system sensor histidine kinase DevS
MKQPIDETPRTRRSLGHTLPMSDPQKLVTLSQPLWDASADGLVLVDDEGVILATNTALDRLFRREPGALIGENIEVLVPVDRRDTHVGLRRGFETAPVSRPMAASRHLEGVRSDGTTFPINVSLGRIDTEFGTYTFATVRDITDRIRVETDVANARRHQAMAEERERIAHDLHDTVIQRLFALGLGLQGLSPRIEKPEVASKVSAAVDTIDDIIDDLRSTIYGLRHRVGSQATTRDRVFSIVDEMQPSLGFAPTVVISGDIERLTDPGIIEHLLAVLREALSNTARHADASEATVTLGFTSNYRLPALPPRTILACSAKFASSSLVR